MLYPVRESPSNCKGWGEEEDNAQVPATSQGAANRRLPLQEHIARRLGLWESAMSDVLTKTTWRRLYPTPRKHCDRLAQAHKFAQVLPDKTSMNEHNMWMLDRGKICERALVEGMTAKYIGPAEQAPSRADVRRLSDPACAPTMSSTTMDHCD